MREVQGDLFAQKADAICITTNGYVNQHGTNVMGAGVAKQAAHLYPDLSRILGQKIQKEGNKVHLLTQSHPMLGGVALGKQTPPYHLVSFPTKPMFATVVNVLPRYRNNTPDRSGRYPGWMAFSNPELIYCSALELVALADDQKWENVALPPAGCGMGSLDWKEVGSLLAPVLDDRFTIVHYPRR